MNRADRKLKNKTEADRLAQETLDNMKTRSSARREDMADFFEKWSASRIFKTALIVLPVILCVFAVLTITNANTKVKQQDLAILAEQSKIDAKQSEIDALTPPPANVEYIQASLNSAREAGMDVAKLQNNYKTLRATFLSTNDGGPLTENAVALGVYLENAADAQGCWYYAPLVTYEWQFETTYEFKAGTSACLWTCYDANDVLLAYATGLYNAATNKFANVAFFVTVIGQGQLETAQEPTPTPTPMPLLPSITPTSTPIPGTPSITPTPTQKPGTPSITPTPTSTVPTTPTTYNPINHDEG